MAAAAPTHRRPLLRSVADNGTILEQAQILISHNLAPLVVALELRDELSGRAGELADRALRHLAARAGQPAPSRHSALIQVKHLAYALRQALFWLSLATAAEQRAAADEVSARLAGTRLAPAAAGLVHVVDGGRFDAVGTVPGGTGRRLLGWSVGTHWALAPAGRP